MSSSLDGLVPTRFLCLTAHLIVTIMIFWVRDYNVRASLSSGYTPEEYTAKDTEIIVGLSVALGLFVVEFIGFFGGISMFMHSQGLLSMTAHAAGAGASAYFIWWRMVVLHYWYIVAGCNGIPALLDLSILINKKCIRGI